VRSHPKSRVLLFSNIIGWLSVAGFYGWLSRLQCVYGYACGYFLIRVLLLVADEFARLKLAAEA
jgi:hypothetical protein